MEEILAKARLLGSEGDPAEVRALLDVIAQRVKAGTPAEKFKEAVDLLLGTSEPEQDEALDAAWELAHRAQQR